MDVGFVETFDLPVTLERLKTEPALAEMPLVKKGNRLSVMPVEEAQWQAVLAMRQSR